MNEVTHLLEIKHNKEEEMEIIQDQIIDGLDNDKIQYE